MLLEEERRELCRAGRRLVTQRLTDGWEGGLGLRAGDLVAVTPAESALDRLEPDECPVLTLDGRVLEGSCDPHAETGLYLRLLRDLDAGSPVGAVAHMQGEFATAVSAALPELPPIHHRARRLGGAVQVAPYSVPNTPELADAALAALHKGGRALLLANHGGLALGGTVQEAVDNAALLEWLCAAYVRARSLGEPRVLSEEDLHRIGEAERQGWRGPDIF
jgi:L-fuculose-phosphate aldolase